jgi:zinc ribbon protein/immunoglobulin I-set domain protein
MFCTECGQQMADEAKFCAYCGTRRTLPASANDAPAPALPKLDAPSPNPAPPLRTIRSTAEIMPIRVRPAPPQPPVDEPSLPDQVTEWPEQESAAPPMYVPEPPASRRESPSAPTRPNPPASQSYGSVPSVEPSAPARYASVPFAADPADASSGRRKMSPVLIGAVLVALIAIVGIVWMVRSSVSFGGKSAAPVSITIYPTKANAAPGKGIDFVAEVTGAPPSDVTWSIEEGDNEGTIKTRGASAKEDTMSLYCTYTTPQKPGTYHLVATSTADKSKSATAEITVAGK